MSGGLNRVFPLCFGLAKPPLLLPVHSQSYKGGIRLMGCVKVAAKTVPFAESEFPGILRVRQQVCEPRLSALWQPSMFAQSEIRSDAKVDSVFATAPIPMREHPLR